VSSALGELDRRDLPVLLDLSRGGAALQKRGISEPGAPRR
jgi:hypothetical protein